MKQPDCSKDGRIVGDRAVVERGLFRAAQLFIKPWSMWGCFWRRTFVGLPRALSWRGTVGCREPSMLSTSCSSTRANSAWRVETLAANTLEPKMLDGRAVFWQWVSAVILPRRRERTEDRKGVWKPNASFWRMTLVGSPVKNKGGAQIDNRGREKENIVAVVE